jgi:hypothetical protein
MPKISADEQQRFTGGLCERVGKAIAEIQLCRMSAAFAEIPISVPGKPGLNFGNRFDADAGRSEQVIKAAAGDWITTAIDDYRGFDKIHRRNATLGGALDGAGANFPSFLMLRPILCTFLP